MSSNDEVSDDHTIQIISPQDHTPNQNHEQTPVATSTNPPTPRHESRGVNQMTPEELSSLKEDLTRYIRRNDHGGLELKLIIDKCADIVRIPLNDRGDTALHVAAAASECRRLETVKELVQHMSPEDMLIRNLYGTLPVHLAILYGRNEMVQILLSQEVLDKMDSEDIERLFFMTIRVDMFDCAMQLFEKHPTDLAIARNEEQLTALHMLARKPPKILGGNKESKADELLQKLWTQVNQLPREWIMNLITHPWSVQFEAVKSGNVEALMILIDKNRELLTIKDPENGRNLLHLVVLFRQERMFRRIFGYEDRIIAVEVDNQGNNILHFAAHLPVEFQELSSLRASIQMQRELEWFQFVELQVPLELRIMRNNMGRRPIDVFYEEHKKLSEEIKDAGKGISESGMLVAALVAT
ncbi:uncharacterized protein LOC114383609 isoform X1 [Glycine soja]|uniref:Uncharacterized protein n=1 Tax=Glycine soja TaxID=3848 RepID=A0A445H138_GLYSO|nr:uncharacterized protein LOC114383609 isoform X1 [Glycine soja]RZB67330.1 hypothetical protein D0Y65_037621 [Glycine soja]